jgi:hypothetical protein
MKKMTLFACMFALLISPAVFSKEKEKEPEVPKNTKKIVRGKVNKVTIGAGNAQVVVVDLPPADGKTWGDRVEIPWGGNFIKDGKPVEKITYVNGGEDIAIMTDVTYTKNKKTVPGAGPADPSKEVEEIVSATGTMIYLGSDARKLKEDGTIGKEDVSIFKPMEKPKSIQEIRENIKTKEDLGKALRDKAITPEEYLQMLKTINESEKK